MPDTAETRPRVIVHMTSSVDGRTQSRRWSRFAGAEDTYETVHKALAGDAWMCGRTTMQGYTRGQPSDDADPTPVPRTDHIARRDAGGFAVVIDAHGKLHWGARNDIEGDHVIVVTSEAVSDAHVNALRASGVSILFGGATAIDLHVVLGKLHTAFGIRRLLVEGGGGINGTFLAAGLVDELSLLLAPTVDGGLGVPSVFDTEAGAASPAKDCAMTLTACDALPNGVVRLRYTFAWPTQA